MAEGGLGQLVSQSGGGQDEVGAWEREEDRGGVRAIARVQVQSGGLRFSV